MPRLPRPLAALAALLAVVPFAAGCRKEPAPPPAFTVEESPAPAPAAAAEGERAAKTPPGGTFVGRWRGTLPCADCPGIDTELELYSGPGGINGPFHLVETYAARKGEGRRVETAGEWLAQRGTEKNPEATVYRLEPAAGGAPRFLLAVEDDLEALDAQARPLASRANLRLKLLEDQHGAAPAR